MSGDQLHHEVPDVSIVDDGEAVANDGADDWEDKQRLPPIPVGEGAGKDGVGECRARPNPFVLDGKVVLKDLHLILDRLIGVSVEVVAEGVIVAQFKVANLQWFTHFELGELFKSGVSADALDLLHICLLLTSSTYLPQLQVGLDLDAILHPCHDCHENDGGLQRDLSRGGFRCVP